MYSPGWTQQCTSGLKNLIGLLQPAAWHGLAGTECTTERSPCNAPMYWEQQCTHSPSGPALLGETLCALAYEYRLR
jgi:hypothetical protein